MNDLLIFGGTISNRYGHVAIGAEVTENAIQLIQQKPGPDRSSREYIPIIRQNDKWYISESRILGWLRKE